MTKAWNYRPTLDKLSIFVSSRLEECKEERSVVRDVIMSLNHQPVLFEHLGARAYSARDLYLSRLRDSNAMIAIYKSGYGYVDAASSMEISGLEDEFRSARDWGVDTLFYVQRSPERRDTRLAKMINEVEAHQTIAYFNEVQELQRVRDDLTALITVRFLSAPAQRGALQETSSDILTRASGRGVVVDRVGLTEALTTLLLESPVVCVHGPPGIGKTTLAAQFAQQSDGFPPHALSSLPS